MTAPEHHVEISCEPPSSNGALVLNGGHRARCSCGWSSGCYAQTGDTQRATEAHLRGARRADFEDLIARSSVGAAVRDIEERGIDAHLADLEREMRRRRRRKNPAKKKRGRRATTASRATTTALPDR